jgi:hypothetical protein
MSTQATAPSDTGGRPRLPATAWRRRGPLLSAPGEPAWARTHAALPAVEALDESRVSLYYSPRDDRGRAHVARATVAVAPDGDLRVVAHDPTPVLSPGTLGAFDDSGTTMSCVLDGEQGTLLYYTGWTRGVTVPFYFYVGLAIRPFGRREFARVSPAPLLERNAVDPYLTASPWVLREDGEWRMWYVSCTGWDVHDGRPRHLYHLRYAESPDGVRWRREGRVAIDFADEREYALSRPCVVRDGDRYRMWFAARGTAYRLGYAESTDGLRWERDDGRAGLEPAAQGWDSEMVSYPAVFDRAGRRYLLYNGNGYGRTGIGYAVQETPSERPATPKVGG